MAADYAPAYVRTEDIDTLWPWLGSFIRRAFAKAPSLIGADDLRDLARQNKARFWVVSKDGSPVAVAATCEHANATVEIVALAGTGMGRWLLPALAAFEAMAKDAGMARIAVCGRRGWERRLAPLGYVVRDHDEDGLALMEKAL